MQRLADEVGIAKGAIYREFASKDALLGEVLSQAHARLQRRVTESLGDGLVSLSEAYRAWATTLLDEPLLCAAYTDDVGVLGAHVDRIADGRYRDRHDALEQWIRALQGEQRLSEDVDAAGLALALSAATLGLLTAAKVLGPLDRDEIAGALEALAVLTRALETP